MKKSKLFARIFSILLCSVLTASAMSGCGNKGGESSTPSQSSDSSSSSTGSESNSDGKGDLYIEGSEGVTLTYWIPIGSTARKTLQIPVNMIRQKYSLRRKRKQNPHAIPIQQSPAIIVP